MKMVSLISCQVSIRFLWLGLDIKLGSDHLALIVLVCSLVGCVCSQVMPCSVCSSDVL